MLGAYHVTDARSKPHQVVLIEITVEKVSMRRDFPFRRRVIGRSEHSSIGIEDGEPSRDTQ